MPGTVLGSESPCRCLPNPHPPSGRARAAGGVGPCVHLLALSPISCVSWCPWEADDISASSWEQRVSTRAGRGGSAELHEEVQPTSSTSGGLSAGAPRSSRPWGQSPHFLSRCLPEPAHLQGSPQDKVTPWLEDHTD